MTTSCDHGTKWGVYGNEKNYWRAKLTEVGVAWSETDSLPTLKFKWQTRPTLKKKVVSIFDIFKRK